MCDLTDLEKIEVMKKALIKIIQLPAYREDEAHLMAFNALKDSGFLECKIEPGVKK